MAIYLTNERYEEIKQKVVNLFVQHRVSCVPVNGFELALKMGIRVIPYSAIAQNKRHLLIKKVKMVFVLKKLLANGSFITMMKKTMDALTILFFMK